MRRFSLPLVALAAILVSAVALARSDRVTAEFSPLGIQLISGVAVIDPGNHRLWIHGQLKNLVPNTEYVLQTFQGGCDSGGGTVLVHVTSNPAGMAVFNLAVDGNPHGFFGSIGVFDDPGPSGVPLACANFNP